MMAQRSESEARQWRVSGHRKSGRLTISKSSAEQNNTDKKIYISRCDGIGRRDGLKIRWANTPCGFEPRHRHHFEYS